MRSKRDRDELEKWQRRFKEAIAKRSDQSANWHRWASLVDDRLWGGQRLEDGSMPAEVNELKACILAILPYIILEPPVIEVRAYNIEDVQLAAIWERVAETVDTRLDLFSTFTKVAYDGLLYGDGVVKVGVWEDVLIDRPLWGSGLTEPFGSRISAHASHTPLEEVYPDYRVNDWYQQGFLIHQFPRHIDDIKSNDLYDKKVTRKLQPNLSTEVLYDVKLVDDNMQDEYIAIQEIHDFREGRVYVMAIGAEDWLYRGPEPYSIVPFERLQFMFRPNSIWGDSISQVVEGHQKSLSETVTYMNRAVAREGLVKVLLRLAEWNPDALRKLESSNDEVIGINAADLSRAIEVIDYKTPVKEYNFTTAIALLRQIIRGSTGVSLMDRGEHEHGVETLGEAGILKTASDIRNRLRLRMFSRFASRVLSKLLYIISLTYSPERICRLAGLSPAHIYSRVLSAGGPFDETRFKIEYGQTAMNSRDDRVQKLLAFQRVMGPFMQYVNPIVFAKMATDAFGFDWNTEMMLYQALGISTGGVSQGNSTLQQPARVMAQSRLVQSGGSSAGGASGMGLG